MQGQDWLHWSMVLVSFYPCHFVFTVTLEQIKNIAEFVCGLLDQRRSHWGGKYSKG